MDPNPDKEDMEYGRLYDEREHHWRTVFEDNDGEVDSQKAILHAKTWDVYITKKEALIQDPPPSFFKR